jgi:hypothetical protein
VSALEAAGPSKEAFGYVSADGVLLRNGPVGGLDVEIVHVPSSGEYQIRGAGIGNGVLLVTREMTGGYGGDDIYVRVRVDGPDQFTVLFNTDAGSLRDVSWFFHILMP